MLTGNQCIPAIGLWFCKRPGSGLDPPSALVLIVYDVEVDVLSGVAISGLKSQFDVQSKVSAGA